MKVLAVDVGRGTQDILLYDSREEPENSIQMILPSRTVLLASRIEDATRSGDDVVMKGVTMGGGPITKAARRHIEAGGRLMATPDAARTFSDDPDKIKEMGVVLVSDDEAAVLDGRRGTVCLETADVCLDSLRRSLGAWGIKADFEDAAVSVQDHGAAPPGQSDRRYRFAYFRETLSVRPKLTSQCFTRDDLPDRFTRMRGVAGSLDDMNRMIVMDTGYAALLGACMDHRVSKAGIKVLVNAGNGHILGALVCGLVIRSFLEHHTRKLPRESFPGLIEKMVCGKIDDMDVFDDGGHGAYADSGEYPDPREIEMWSITGPRRQKFASSPPGFYQAAPFGSMMQTGCFGLLAAFFTRFCDTAGMEQEKCRRFLKTGGE